DNLPPALLSKMAELTTRPGGPARVAIVVDARGGVFFGELSKALEELKKLHADYRILFLEASDQDLVNRYEATRRRHPLAPGDRVVEGIRKERHILQELRGHADLVIDTSGLTPHELRDRIRESFVNALLDVTVPGYVAEGKSYLTVSVGCTGGHHRSVVVAEALGAYFRERGLPVVVVHRDVDRG